MAAAEQGDVALLDDLSAQTLLIATVPAHLAYTWTDGTDPSRARRGVPRCRPTRR